ncbi:hypothetical protein R16034_00893 [Ralstonia edaphis]|uniref:GAF domain-containing protein n=1 Tax=Ralstonia edaphi TaxID=3058599 RepID=A0AB72WXU1_9RALS|nr:GAF domain-containing protein [Ralstonia sp. LMG 6871]CAJ0737913.1 hypothetical protein R16034_00893 [Ralstonia sp. LMG 6871]
MSDYPVGARESERVEAVLACGILDTADDPKFDRLTRLACHALGVPMALVSIVDDRRQWFKSRHGLDTRETPRKWAFCNYAILGAEPFIVEDAAADPTFADNPLVTGHPFIRFYAGAPLVDRAGYALGTLCVLDVVPRQIDAAQIAVLQDLAHFCSHIITSQADASVSAAALL